MATRCLVAVAAVALGGCPAARTPDTVPIRCAVGERPPYFVPSDTPPVLVGCARLGVSGKRVDFSVSRSRLDGRRRLCIDTAYSRGLFIPSVCKLRPPPARLAIRYAGRVRGHRYVVWGTAPPGTSGVRVGSVRAAVFAVRVGRPFVLFVAELPGARPVSVVSTCRRTARPAPCTCRRPR
jgi:hypothetical protein